MQWILLAYTPDGSKVRDRMLYASTRDTLKKELGRSYFVDELYGSEKVLYNSPRNVTSDGLRMSLITRHTKRIWRTKILRLLR